MIKRKRERRTAIDALSSAQDLVFAPLTFQALASLLDLGIIKILDEKPSTIAEVIEELSLNEYIVRTLFEVAEVSDLIKKDDDRYSLTTKAQMFIYDDMTIANFNFVKDVCYLGASELTKSFKEEAPVGLHKFIGDYPTIYPALSILPEKIKNSWYAFDHLYSNNCFSQVLSIINNKYNKIFDIGGNTGNFEKVCLKNNCDITMLDLPENIAVVLKDKDLEGCHFHPINVLEPTPKYPKFDSSAVLMSQFLDCFSKSQIKKILMDISNNMDNNSTIYILEPFTDKQKFKAAKSSLIHISLYFTCIANGVSKMYTQEEFLELIAQCNLKIKEIHNDIGAFDYTLLECGK